jgi:hypothetical protein
VQASEVVVALRKNHLPDQQFVEKQAQQEKVF